MKAMMQRMLALCLAAICAANAHAGEAPSDAAQVLPTVYEAGHFFAVPETHDGQKLKLLVDTGGGGGSGMYWITQAAAQRLQLASVDCTIEGKHPSLAHLPDYKAGRGLPPPGEGPCAAALMVLPQAHESDGQLGASYLLGRVWTFDYPAQRMTMESASWRPSPAAHESKLGFPHDAQGRQQTGFARITIRVDGEPLDMLLDTGATSYPTPEAARISGTPTVNGQGVTSYITNGKFKQWHQRHPEWRVVEHADYKVAMGPLKRIIEVPKLQIAGWSVGPVWFTEQPDMAYHQYMAEMMDKPVEGVVGGNVFQHFAMTIDYPHESAYFRCVKACVPAGK